MQHGDVLVTRDSAPPEEKTTIPGIEASSIVRRAALPAQLDIGDPWETAASKLPARQPPAPSAADMAKLEAAVVQKVLEKVQKNEDVTMDSNEGRIMALEQQMQQLAHSQEQQKAQTQDMKTQLEQVTTQLDQQATQYQQCLAN